MFVVLRIGPWAHGECRHGGFPDWLLDKGLKLRTNDPAYMLNLLHLFVQDFGDMLAPMGYVAGTCSCTSPEDEDTLRYSMRTDGEHGFIFVNNHQRYLALKDKSGVEFEALGRRLPAIDVRGDVCFFLPVNMELTAAGGAASPGVTDETGRAGGSGAYGKTVLEYATAQPLCRLGNTYFFVGIDNIKPRFKFTGHDEITASVLGLSELQRAACTEAGGYASGPALKISDRSGEVRICVLDFEAARYLRRLSGRLVLGIGCNLFETGEGIASIENSGSTFVEFTDGPDGLRLGYGQLKTGSREPELAREALGKLTVGELKRVLEYPAAVAEEIIAELHADEDTELTVYGLKTDTPDGFVTIRDRFDVGLVVADGKLLADRFYDGLPWRLPCRLLYGRDARLLMTAERTDVFIDD